MRRDDATERQVQAADPACSTWLSANAGSGKTRVLTDRVARLLLNGVLPERILCLTYTKAAASEMQNRLFRGLGEWAMLGQDPLCAKLRELGLDRDLDDQTIRRARRLFARAIEAPGGLRIQTIHSFCAGLLRRFPLEAGVSPQFTEMDDRSAKRLRDEILDDIASGPNAQTFDDVALWFSGIEIGTLLREIAKNRSNFPRDPDSDALWRAFDLSPGTSETDLLASVFLGGEGDLIARLVQVLQDGGVNDMKAANRLERLDLSAPDTHTLVALEGIFLTGAKTKAPYSAKVGSFPTKSVRIAHPDILPALDDLMGRVESARQMRVALHAAQKTLVLHRFAAVFLPEFSARKLHHGWLDFDDLILKTRDLLTDPGLAEWVLYRLDGGIDHILVDEAQDTSPVQWQIIELLAQEFAAGEGARAGVARTIFVVGDKKQSIYSFQGADPAGFDMMRDKFSEKLLRGSNSLQNLVLEYSFRSSDAILRTVDSTFRDGARQGLGDTILHRAFHSDMPGRVDLWPLVEKSENPAQPELSDPVDILASEHHTVQLADRIAAEIQHLIRSRETLWQKTDGRVTRRAIRPGDFLILVQRRSALFHEIIRACKAAELPIAGADRLKIGGELAVRDLRALLAFLATPEDSLSLAGALHSPIFGWSEDDIYRAAAGRTEKYLWATLRSRKDTHREVFSILDGLMRETDFLRPYELIEHILTRHRARENLIARLGPEASDGIDALLFQALAYERAEVPSLTGFLGWLDSGNVEIKRQMDSAGNRIRVMTVHGAKGLEAPIVILPDSGKRTIQIKDELLAGPGGLQMWKTSANDSPKQVTAARNALIERQEEERQRLLYVAMTRAEQWLITCAAGDLDNGKSWYEKVRDGMTHAGATTHDFEFGLGLRLESGIWEVGDLAAADKTPTEKPALPDWALTHAAPSHRPPAPISPSGLGGAKILPGDSNGQDEATAMRRGSAIHLLLERLPSRSPEHWQDLAMSLLSDGEQSVSNDEINGILAETVAVLRDPKLADLFSTCALTEVDITANIPALDGARLYGAIDRLIISDGHVLAVDFKTNAVVPDRAQDVPDGLLCQMGAYGAALAEIYPDRRIETAILWTRTQTLMRLPSQLVAQALAATATS